MNCNEFKMNNREAILYDLDKDSINETDIDEID